MFKTVLNYNIDIRGAGAIVRSASLTMWAQQGASEFRSEDPLFESWPGRECPGRGFIYFPSVPPGKYPHNIPKLCHDFHFTFFPSHYSPTSNHLTKYMF
jgi:hypothetical protein